MQIHTQLQNVLAPVISLDHKVLIIPFFPYCKLKNLIHIFHVLLIHVN